MKREIKFRAWDTVNNKWLFGYELLGGFSLIGEVVLMGQLNTVRLEDWNSIEIMQYTGLKDKDSKDVYEGDIVKLTNTGHGFNIGIVVWGAHSTPSFTAEQINEDFPSTYHLQVRPSEIEILGNIHEHKNILL